jgi:hypothetical protein
MEPIRRTFIGSESEFIGYKKLLTAKAEAKKKEEARQAMMKARKSKLAALRRKSQIPSQQLGLKAQTTGQRDGPTP